MAVSRINLNAIDIKCAIADYINSKYDIAVPVKETDVSLDIEDTYVGPQEIKIQVVTATVSHSIKRKDNV